jgi:DNA ligase-1
MYREESRRGRARCADRGASSWRNFQLAPLSPIAPMLAQTAADVGEALEQLGGECASNGRWTARASSCTRSAIRAHYTRSSNEVTAAVPEIVETAQGLAGARDDPRRRSDRVHAGGRPHAVSSHDAPLRPQARCRAAARRLPMRAFFFDCLHFEGESLTWPAGARALRCAGARGAVRS